MSQTVEGTPRGLRAGNTVENLSGIDRDVAASQTSAPSSADLDAVAAEQSAAAATTAPVSDTAVADDVDPLDDENTFDVSRAEFNELRDAFLRLYQRVDKYNLGASHKI